MWFQFNWLIISSVLPWSIGFLRQLGFFNVVVHFLLFLPLFPCLIPYFLPLYCCIFCLTALLCVLATATKLPRTLGTVHKICCCYNSSAMILLYRLFCSLLWAAKGHSTPVLSVLRSLPTWTFSSFFPMFVFCFCKVITFINLNKDYFKKKKRRESSHFGKKNPGAAIMGLA